MTTLILATWIAVTPVAETATEADEPFVTSRTRAQWVQDVGDALRAQARATDSEQPFALVRLVSLYQQVVKDEDLHHAERNRLRLKLRARLVRIGDELQIDLRKRQTRIAVVKRRAKAEDKPEKLKTIEADEAILAQWDAALGQVIGGNQQGAAGGDKFDHGQQLVDLIQRVISPDTWDVNGGPSAIVYYKGLRVLVVSATSEVHHQIGGLGRGLRR